MLTLHEALGVDGLLVGVDSLLSSWSLFHPDLGRLTSRAEVARATRTGTCEARNGVLRALAELAAHDGGDSREAAALLCLLVAPGVVTKIAPLFPKFGRDEVNQVAAGHLWLEVRQFPFSSDRPVAATICWRVRTATFADFNLAADVARSDRTWANCWLAEDMERAGRRAVVAGGFSAHESEAELAELVWQAETSGLLGAGDVELLRTVLAVAERHPDRQFRTNGLMSGPVSLEAGQLLGVGASTLRRHLLMIILVLREVAHCLRGYGTCLAGEQMPGPARLL